MMYLTLEDGQEVGPFNAMRRIRQTENGFRFYGGKDPVEYLIPFEQQTLDFWWHCEEMEQIPKHLRSNVAAMDNTKNGERRITIVAGQASTMDQLLGLLR
jgi:hypothetical protein